MTSADYDIAGTAASTGDGKARRHISWQWCAVVSAALMDVVEMTALGQLRALVDRYLMGDAEGAYDDLQHGRLVGRAGLMPAHSETHLHTQHGRRP